MKNVRLSQLHQEGLNLAITYLSEKLYPGKQSN